VCKFNKDKKQPISANFKIKDHNWRVSGIDSFTVGKHGDVFLWTELRWRQKDPSGRFTNASKQGLLACFF